MSTHVDVRTVKGANDIGRSTSIKKLDHEFDDILLTVGNGLESHNITKRLEDTLETVRDRTTIQFRITCVEEDGGSDASLIVRDTIGIVLPELGGKLLSSHRMQAPVGVGSLNLLPGRLGLAEVVETNVDDTASSQLIEDGSTKGAVLVALAKDISKPL